MNSKSNLTGFKVYRHKDNPEEKRFHDKFIEHNSYNAYDMDRICFPPKGNNDLYPSDVLSSRERQIVISAIQWLGSPVGQSFLRELGYEKSK